MWIRSLRSLRYVSSTTVNRINHMLTCDDQAEIMSDDGIDSTE